MEGINQMRYLSRLVLSACSLVCGIGLAQESMGLVGEPGGKLNQELVQQRMAGPIKASSKDVVVFIGDRVIPHLVDGGSWQTVLVSLT
jgi:hypothetical protein